jgi:nucleotide-binding universal stress UspA family protein
LFNFITTCCWDPFHAAAMSFEYRIDGVPHVWPDQRTTHEQGRTDLESYLKEKADQLVARLNVSMIPQVRTAIPAAEILMAADELEVDLIALASHGRTGLERWRLGSVADKVVRSGLRPTLLIGPNVKLSGASVTVKRVSVPLDGSNLAAHAIGPAASLARSLGAVLQLVTVPVYHVPFWQVTNGRGVRDGLLLHSATFISNRSAGPHRPLSPSGPGSDSARSIRIRPQR